MPAVPVDAMLQSLKTAEDPPYIHMHDRPLLIQADSSWSSPEV